MIRKENMGFKIVFGIFYSLIVIISASTSFSFWFNYFGNLIPPGLMTDVNRYVISGLVGIILFDIASLVWLWTYLLFAENSQQRFISQTMVVVTFIGATTASVFHLIMSSPLSDIILNDTFETRLTWVSLVFVILGVAANFGAGLVFTRYSEENQQRVRDANRISIEQRARKQGEEQLDAQMSKLLLQKIRRMAPDLAEQQAQEIAANFSGQETVSKSVEKTNKATAKANRTRSRNRKQKQELQYESSSSGANAKAEKLCPECGEPARPNGIYCGNNCRSKASRRRNKK